jgi:N6-L-threonylcarbamoyladenine synthase
MKILAIETTCDETAAAIIGDDLKIFASVVASQEALHEQYNGVVPEIAARAHVERMLPVIQETVQKSGLSLADDIDAIAVANTPGLAGSLLVGVTAAKALALSLDKPLVAINHLHAHVYACQLDAQRDVFPCVGMIVSGGHTHLYRYTDALSPEYLGGTIDDAAGEAFDKVASMLGLPYPGGPAISKIATEGNAEAHRYPRSFLKEDRLDFSFSGLKTAVRYSITGPGNIAVDSIPLDDQQKSDIAASFQQAVVDCLVAKAIQAVKKYSMNRICVGGGVAANRVFRQQLQDACDAKGIELFIAPLKYCTDNAVMGAIAFEKLKAGLVEELSVDILPGLVRA